MKRFSCVEYGGLALGALILIAGLVGIIWPHARVIPHDVNGPGGGGAQTYWEVVSEAKDRVYGVISVVFGTILTLFVVFRDRADEGKRQPKN